jgi:solute carrier family 25 aspartate/glutamate transporter 12/13
MYSGWNYTRKRYEYFTNLLFVIRIAIKLTSNDFFRYQFTNKETGEIKKWQEGVSGGLAGLLQVVITNPYEIVKVRLQTQTVLAGHQRKTAFSIMQELGPAGMYKGASACLLRDVPFR